MPVKVVAYLMKMYALGINPGDQPKAYYFSPLNFLIPYKKSLSAYKPTAVFAAELSLI